MDIQNSDTFSILYATDIHYIRKYALYVPAYYKVKEMVEFSKYAGFDLMALTGDIVDGNTNTNWDDVTVLVDGGWDCVLIDKKRRTLKTKRYGVNGADRQIEF